MSAEKPLAELSIERLKEIAPELEQDVKDVLGTGNAVKSFASEGSTAPQQVAAEVERWKELLDRP